MTAPQQKAARADLPHWSFGDSPEMADALLALVLSGTKTASCAALSAYEAEGEMLPRPGARSIILDGQGRPACVVETTEVTVRRFADVDAGFAFEEGEDDRSLASWREGHRAFFARNGGFSDDMMLVCERFRLVEVLPAAGGRP